MDDKKKVENKDHLEGFDIKINEFGEIESNFDIDRINVFLDKNVEDKKLIEHGKELLDNKSTEEE